MQRFLFAGQLLQRVGAGMKGIGTRCGVRRGFALRPLLAVGLALFATVVQAEGSRTLHPQGYFSDEAGYDARNYNAGRAPLNLSSNVYADKVRARTFLYVYAKPGEVILAGANSAPSVTLYSPSTDFGPKGHENPSGGTAQSCSITSSVGRITNRTAELAGPRSADGSAGADDGWTPCVFNVTEEGIYGVLFGGATKQNMWDVTVRANAQTTQDIDGRVFTYAYAGATGGNNRTPDLADATSCNSSKCRLYTTQYYVTADGYRYKQELKGTDPDAYVLYANTFGFLDSGEPLYRNVRSRSGSDYLASLFGQSNGIALQAPEYPLFFSDVMTAEGIDDTLTALGIPLQPPAPVVSNVSFTSAHGTSHTYVGMGGVISFDAVDVTTYQIVLSWDGVDWDVNNPFNRVLTGSAVPGRNNVVWDGRGANGVPFPVK
jgi:hypothetical protein